MAPFKLRKKDTASPPRDLNPRLIDEEALGDDARRYLPDAEVGEDGIQLIVRIATNDEPGRDRGAGQEPARFKPSPTVPAIVWGRAATRARRCLAVKERASALPSSFRSQRWAWKLASSSRMIT
jgi:hypothetical protein